jgi:phosphopantothenoylcysteine decarboxylase/phosphopantothenate--cysteine ligase
MTANQKTVLIGVTGCIGAYKACEILRGLQKADVRVKVVMTEHATHFVDPLTFRALTHEPVAVGLFDDPSDPIHHISLAAEADLFLLAPCTANVMAKVAHGIADDLLSTTVLATTAPVVIAPAMNVNMYENVITQQNMATLKARGYRFIEPGSGYLACGYEGKGRLAEPADIVAYVLKVLEEVEGADEAPAVKQDLAGKKVVITAGPTVEPIDPVRFISNHSSGKFGYAIATAAVTRGAEVTLISGPVKLDPPVGVKLVNVGTACQMLDAMEEAFPTCDIAIFAAAVADLRPANPKDRKMKKGQDDDSLATIKLVENPDILSTMGHKKDGQIVVGFAAETNDVVENATRKLERKNADMIVANEVGATKAFGKDDNEIWFVTANGAEHVPSAPKSELAHVILDKTLQILA